MDDWDWTELKEPRPNIQYQCTEQSSLYKTFHDIKCLQAWFLFCDNDPCNSPTATVTFHKTSFQSWWWLKVRSFASWVLVLDSRLLLNNFSVVWDILLLFQISVCHCCNLSASYKRHQNLAGKLHQHLCNIWDLVVPWSLSLVFFPQSKEAICK